MHHRQTTGTIISRITAGVLCLLMFFFAVPLNLYAEAIDALENAHNAVASDAGQDLYSYLGAAYEVESLREEYVKHFHLEDGTYVAARYPYPVHEKTADGSFCDIDNRLSETAGGLFANADTRVKFAKKITGNETLFTLHEKGTKLTLSLQGAKKGTAGRVENGSDAQDATTLQKLLHQENLSSKILYPDILPGADLEYVVGSGNIKENLLVKERSDTYSYTFDLSLNGLTARLSEDGDILLTEEDTGNVRYTMPAPVVYDANSVYAPAALSSYTLTAKNGGKYELTVTVSAAIPGRLAHWKMTDLPSIPASAYITDATISLRASLSFGDHYVAAYEVLTDWDESLTWNRYTDADNPEGQRGDTVIDYNKIFSGFYSWNITPLVRKWYAGENYGVAFDKAPGKNASLSFWSSEATDTGDRPVLTVSYRDMKGTEPYFPSSSHSAGIAGTGSILLSNGQPPDRNDALRKHLLLHLQ